MTTSSFTTVDGNENLPTDSGFFITFVGHPTPMLATMCFQPIDDASRLRDNLIADRSDNYTFLDLCTYAEVYERVMTSMDQILHQLVVVEAGEPLHWRMCSALIRIPDPSYCISRSGHDHDEVWHIPSAYFGMYNVRCGDHSHNRPFLITSTVPDTSIVEGLFAQHGHAHFTMNALAELIDDLGPSTATMAPYSWVEANIIDVSDSTKH